MKRRLNVLCLIVLLVLGYSIVEMTYYVGMGIKTGLQRGFNEEVSLQEKKEIANLQLVYLMPENFDGDILSDSVYNVKSGEYVSASFGQLAVSVDTKPSVLSRIVTILLVIADYVAIIWALVLFVRLIIAINRSDIFNWKNVRRLRRLGVMLIVSFGCALSIALLSLYNVKKVFAMSGYSLTMGEMVQITSLVLGLSALIVAEVFAIGLKMKEEQELTI